MKGNFNLDYPVKKTEEDWREELTDFEYHVLREAGTERDYTGELLEEKRTGTFRCRGCQAELFKSTTRSNHQIQGFSRKLWTLYKQRRPVLWS